MENTPTALQAVDLGTKPTLAPVLFHAYDYATSVRFYPPVDSEHANLMDLVTYNATHTFTIPNPSSSAVLPMFDQLPCWMLLNLPLQNQLLC